MSLKNKIKDDEVFRDFFSIHNRITNSVLVDIVIDRDFNIPDWLYEFINEDVIVSILLVYKQRFIENSLKGFINEIVNRKVIKNKKYFIQCVFSHEISNFASILNPKDFYNVIKHQLELIDYNTIYNIIKTRNELFGIDIGMSSWYIKTLLKYGLHSNIEITMNISDVCRIMTEFLTETYVSKSHNMEPFTINMIMNAFYEYSFLKFSHIGIFEQWFESSTEFTELMTYYWQSVISNEPFIPYYTPTSLLNLYFDINLNNKKSLKMTEGLQDTMVAYIDGFDLNNDSHFDIPEDMRNNIVQWCKSLISLNYTNINNMGMIIKRFPEIISITEMNYKYHSMSLFDYKNFDFSNYYDILISKGHNYNLALSDLKTFTLNGGNYDNFPVEKMNITDIDDYINFICINLPDDKLISILMSNGKLSVNNVDKNILEFIYQNYIKRNNNNFILNRLYRIIPSNTQLIDHILKELDISFIQLIQYSPFHNYEEIILKYPKLIPYYEDNGLIPLTLTNMILKLRPDTIYNIPWKNVSSESIIQGIKNNGYYKNPDRNEDNDPPKYIPTTSMIELMNIGIGIGYCLDYSLPEYRKTILKSLYHSYENSI